MKKDSAYLHHFGVNLDLVWDTILNKLPILKDDISEILEQINKEN